MANHHTTVFLGRLLCNGLANLSLCMILSHSYFCVQDSMPLMRLHRCTFTSRPSRFVFVINTTFMSWIVCFLLICIYVNLPRSTFTNWAYIWHIFSVNAQTRQSMHAVSQSLHSLSHTQSVCDYGIFYQSMLKQALACVQSHQSLHCSHTCTKWAYIQHILSVNAQASFSVCAVLPESLLLSHMHKLGINMAYFVSQC